MVRAKRKTDKKNEMKQKTLKLKTTLPQRKRNIINNSDKANISNNTLNINYFAPPVFMAYYIVKNDASKYIIDNEGHISNSNIFYKCSKCFKLFLFFHNLKRHYIQAEYNVKTFCKYCGEEFKRVHEHLLHCKTYLSTKNNSESDNSKNEDNLDSKLKSKYSFDKCLIIKNYLNSFIKNYRYQTVNDNFIYFPN